MANPTYDYELVVIGGGPAGEKGAAQAAYFGHKTIVIEAYKELGGACINWGTLASKTLRESALFLSGFRTRQLGEGMDVQFKADVNLTNFMHRKNLVQKREQERAAKSLAAPWHKIDRVTGMGRIADPHTVIVRQPDGIERTITGQYILIASGSVPARPKEVPFNDTNVFDSTTILDMKNLPKSMVVIGAGVIGSEYACLFQALGVAVTLVHPKARALDSLLDGEIGEEFMTRIAKDGVTLAMNDGLASSTLEGDCVGFSALCSGPQRKHRWPGPEGAWHPHRKIRARREGRSDHLPDGCSEHLRRRRCHRRTGAGLDEHGTGPARHVPRVQSQVQDQARPDPAGGDLHDSRNQPGR
jgi:pyruvate/2-oxoglutarate dehydrogenase complex dihydrolipoamide dehydrogenase (E3) component